MSRSTVKPDRLYQILQNTGLQNKDYPLYQLLFYLIGQVLQQSNSSSGGGGGGGGGSTTVVINTLLGLVGEDGNDGEDGPPGISGTIGINGSPGIPGISYIPEDGDDGEDGMPGPPGAAGNVSDFVKFSETVLGADTATVSFTSIPGIYRNIMITVQVRNDNAGTGATDGYIQYNGDTGANYSRSFGAWTGTGNNSGENFSVAKCPAFFAVNNGAAGNLATVFTMIIYNYATTDWKKLATTLMAMPIAITSGNLQGNTIDFFWNNTNVITDILLGMTDTSKFKAGSVFTCYLLR